MEGSPFQHQCCRCRQKIKKDGGVLKHLAIWFFLDLQTLIHAVRRPRIDCASLAIQLLIFLVGPTFSVLPSDIVSFFYGHALLIVQLFDDLC